MSSQIKQDSQDGTKAVYVSLAIVGLICIPKLLTLTGNLSLLAMGTFVLMMGLAFGGFVIAVGYQLTKPFWLALSRVAKSVCRSPRSFGTASWVVIGLAGSVGSVLFGIVLSKAGIL